MKTSASDLPANLSAAKRALLEKRLRGEKITSSVPPLVPSAHAGAMVPLSYAQQRMWFIDQLTPGRSSYNIPGGMRLEGPLNLDALRNSLTEIMRRHESLRTHFVAIKGEPRQVIAEEVSLGLEIVDISSTPENEREVEAKRLAREEARKPFDLEHGPLFRVKLLKLGEREHVLLVTMHHIVSDGWSTDILVREFAMLYGALSSGASSPLPDLSVQYADYAVWQREWMKGSVLESKLAYWKQQLAGVQALELPADKPRPEVQGQNGATLDFELDSQLTDSMRELGRSQGATLYMVLMAALQLLIYRYSGHRDVLVGSPVAGRIQKQIEGLIGLFVNTLVIRTTFQEELTFAELLGRVKKTALEAFGHQDVPFEKLVDALQLERDLSRAPLFQVAFALQGAPPTFELGALRVKPFLVDNGTAKFDLTLMMGEGSSIQCWLEYNTELFDEASAMGMLHHFKTLLQQATRNPQTNVDAIPLLSETEISELLAGWHGDITAPAREQTISELIAAHAEAHPDALALVSDGEKLTYQQLKQKAGEVASRIHEAAGPGARVGIFLERGLDQGMAALAAMTAGSIFVPLDTEEAPQRLRQIVTDAKLSIIITEDKFKEHFPASAGIPLLLLDQPAAEAQQSRTSEAAPAPDNVACILFRSGASGKPQGVLVTQQALCGASFGTTLDYKQEDRVALAINFSHETGALQVFVALAAGACAVNLAQKPALSPWEISKLLQEQRVTVLCGSAALLDRMARSFSAGLKKLRLIVCDDEQSIASRLPEKFRNGMGARAFAVYGSTEAGKWPLLYSLRDIEAIAVEHVAANTRIHLLDKQLEPVPHGVTGEIYIGSDDLAPGYEQLPEITSHAFVSDVLSSIPGAKLYRTGDWGRRRHDGRLQFLGPRNGKISVRGIRVHTKEIESVLVQYPVVKEAAVLVREKDGFREPGIEVFVVPADEKTVALEELRRFLQDRLPEWMLPSSITVVQEIPRTTIGTPDLRILAQKLVEKKHVGARNPIEEILCGIWAQLLGRERVGVYDNFFEIGGDSILSVQVIAQARKAGLQITPRQMFEQQTIAELAEIATVIAVAETEINEAETSMSGPVPISPIQKLFFDWQLAHPEHFNQGVLLQIKPGIDSHALEKAWTALLQHHDALRMKYEGGETGWKQICEDRIPEGTYRRKDLSKVAESEQKTALERDATQVQGSFDLAAGRLVAAVEYDLGAQNGRRLLLAIHHLVVDGISWRILLEDLERGYQQLQAGEAINLGRRTTSFKRWTEGLQQYSNTEVLRQEAGYWKQPRQSKPVPRDFSAGEAENTVESARTLSVQMEKEETRELLHDVPGVYHTQINDVLMTALARVISEWSGGEQVMVDLEGHGREELIPGADISRTVGWFATIHPVALTAGKPWDPGSALKSIKEQLRAVPNNGFGYGILRCIAPDEQVRGELAAMPGSELLFNYLGQVDQIFQVSKLFLPAQESPGGMSASRNRRPYPLEVTAIVAGGQLQVSWTYSEKLHRHETIERIAQHYVECLRQIIEHCRSAQAGGYTPSDFPLARLRQQDLDKSIGRGEGIEDIYGLSPMQQGMLFHSLYESGAGVYFVQLACEVRGGMEAAHFRDAWQTVIQRHKILRTEFLWEGLEEPVQVVRSDAELWWREEDWRGLSATEQQQQWQKFLKEDRQQGFDLRRAPLERFTRVQTGEETYYFCWSTHHILMDGWCLQILLSEAMRIYVARCNGQEADLERPRPYRDYIRWLRQQDEKEAEKFWRTELKGFTAPTRLRLEESIELAEGEEPYDQVSICIPAELLQKLEELARGRQVTLNTVMQVAWAYLLSRYSGEADVLFGATVSGRSADVESIETMVGLFINTVPARLQLQAGETISAHLKRLQDRQSAARQYEYCPLIRVQSWSEIPRGVSLYDTVLVFENFPVDPKLGDSISANLKLGDFQFVERTNLPLFLKVVPGKEMLVVLTYDRRLYREETITRVLSHLNTVMAGMALGLQRNVAELSLLQESERRQVLAEWNSTESIYPAAKCVHELFAEQAATKPQAIAVEYQGRRLTYEELDRCANQFAHHLRKLGVARETRVAVCLERSADLIAALMGILKAGAAYVPLDPNYPAERLKYMLQDSKATAVITRKPLLAKLPAFSGATIRLDEQRAEIEAESVESLPPQAHAENLAYVIYTSGSTGTPKGIGGTHQGIVNRILWMHNIFPMLPEDICCQKTSLSFVDSVAEIFAPLLCGAPLMIVPDETAKDAAELVRFLNARGVTRIVLVPSLLRTMLSPELGVVDALEKLQMVVTSGEALPTDLANLFQVALPKAALLNFYGSSEVAADATWSDLTHRRPSDPVLIGKPIANMRAYVLDEEVGPCAIGITGELYIGGIGMARGYINRGDLTAGRFVPDPFSQTAGERMYRTGDLARWRATGDLEFAGRKDYQVKVRGHRIEMGEVEAVLSADPAVAQAIVVARPGDRNETQLIAYVTSKEKTSAAVLRSRLQQRIPDYMLPSAIVMMETFPLTPSGKIDRRALPAPVFGKEEGAGAGYIVPRTLVEEMLAQIWAEVLKVDKVGINDHFFNMGGQSLLATQVVARVSKTFGTPLKLRHLFEAPTIGKLALKVEELLKGGKKDNIPLLAPVEGERMVPLSHAQQRLWFVEQLAPGSAYNIPAAVRIRGSLQLAMLEKSFQEIARRQASLRTRFVIVNGEARQVVDDEVRIGLPIVDLSSSPEAEQEAEIKRLAIEEGRQVFDLRQAPLLRTKLLRLQDNHHVLLVNMHHIISDAWSIGILVQELALLYRAFVSGQQSPLPDLPVQYTDYSFWQRRWLTKEVLEQKIGYWRKQLAGMERLEFPADRPRPAVQTPNGANFNFRISAELTGRLREIARREGATLYMVLLAAFQTLLHRYSRQNDIVIGSPIAGRTQRDTEGLIGFFVNMLVLRADFSADPEFVALLRRMKELTLEAYAHQEVPFERLVEEFEPDRDLSRTPLIQVAFVLQNAVVQSQLEFGDTRLESLAVDNGTAKFDLTLGLGEDPAGMQGVVQYNTDLFELATVTNMAQRLTRLLQSIVENPEQKVDSLPLISEEERHSLAKGWSGAPLAPLEQTICDRIRTEAQKNAEAIALIEDGAQLGYGELNRRANQVAHGVKGEERVGICLDKGSDRMITALGILKAGAVMVPLDSAELDSRLAHILQDASVRTVITEEKFKARFEQMNVQAVALNELRHASSEEPDVWPKPGAPACILYRTRTQGVLLDHRSLITAASAQGTEIIAVDRVAQRIDFTSEVSGLELFRTLAAGACVVSLPLTPLPPRDLAALIRDSAATVLWIQAATLEQLARKFPRALKDLRLIFCEDSLENVIQLAGTLKPEVLLRLYGIHGDTETAGRGPVYQAKEIDSSVRAINMDRISTGVTVRLLDQNLQPVPAGLIGEIFIGGQPLALGYNHPSMSAEAFISDPWSEIPGQRLYRTRELARRRNDSRLELRGRRDGRIRVSGQRVELKEIEAVLAQQAGVKDAAVLAMETGTAEAFSVIAFVVAAEGAELSPVKLRQSLLGCLPERLVPAELFTVDAIPRSTSGRVDQRSLTEKLKRKDYAVARNRVEEILCGIWKKLLPVEQVGIHDNFFRLGGDSILSIQVITQAREAGIQITPRQMFERQTIAELAEVATVVEAAQGGMEEEVAAGPAPLLPIQRAFFQWGLNKPQHFNQAVLLDLKPEADSSLVEKAVMALLQHHDALRMSYEVKDGGWQQSLREEAPAQVYRRHSLRDLAPEEQKVKLQRDAEETQGSLDLAGQLMRAVEYDLGPDHGRRLLLVIHHLVVDGISWRVLLEDLERGYRQLTNKTAINLGLKTTSCRKWAQAIENYSEQDTLKAETGYWSAEPRRQARRLPLDYPAANIRDNTAITQQTVAVSLDVEATRRLLQEVPNVYHTQVNDALLAALGRACGEWSSSEHVVVDLEGHGREELFPGLDTSRTVGWFTTIYPVLLERGPAQRWDSGALLKTTKEQLRTIPNRGFGYGVLRHIAQDDQVRKQMQEIPQSDLLFNYLGQIDQVFQGSELFGPARENSGRVTAHENRRLYILEVNALVAEGRLQIAWNYSTKLHRRETIERVAQRYLECLQEIIAHCERAEAGGHTPSDFPLADLTQEQVDRWIEKGSDITDVYALTPMQEGMLFHSLYEPGSSLYFTQLGCRIQGPLDAVAFRKAWEEVVQRHSVLRTSFIWEDLKAPVQVVHNHAELPWQEEDWRGSSREEQKRKWNELLRQQRDRGLDLQRAPLMRLALVRIGDESSYFVWGFGHILMDGWCLSIVMGEVFRLYEAYRMGQKPDLRRPPLFRDYIAWLRGQDEKKAEAFWRSELQGFKAPTRLRIERERRAGENGHEGHKLIRQLLSREATARLEELARTHQVTLNAVAQGAWGILLSRYNGDRDVVFGATVAGRSAGVPGIEGIVGLFINTLPVRAQLRDDESVIDYLKRLQQRQVEARDFEYTPLVKVQGWSEVPAATPLFESILVFENYPVDAALQQQIGATMKMDDVQVFNVTNYPLSLRVTPAKEMAIDLTYRRQIYDDKTAERLLGHLIALLEQIGAEPQRPAGQISLLMQDQYRQMLDDWNEEEDLVET